jgi:peptide/nickel transport system permease protein
MLLFLTRRIFASILLLLVASFFVYMMMAYAGDPLAFLNEITNPTQRAAIERDVTAALNLNDPPIVRYFQWLGDVLTGDFGISARTRQSVNDELATRIPITLKLVVSASVLSIVIGVVVGIVTALRQYTGFDYIVTFFTFVFFSLPVFWIAVILKDVGGIRFNDWLRDGADIAPWIIALGAVFAGIIGYSIAGGRTPRRLVIGGISAAVGAGLLIYLSVSGWFLQPGIGLPVLVPLAAGIAVGCTAVFAGIRNRKALFSSLSVAAIGCIVYTPLQTLFDKEGMGWLWTLGLLIVTLIVGAVVGLAWGGYDKGLSARVAMTTGFLISIVIFIDRMMQSWQEYSEDSVIRGRPIKTIGHKESRLEGSFWVLNDDTFSHLILPTMALMLISLAAYTRYSRASMLEVLNQDYIRTARAKGLTERTVIVRHGLRNALIPLATVIAFDIGGLLGGAVITETVFEWNGMGRLFIEGLQNLDPNPVMAATMVVGATAVVANILADLMYSVLDPRIRIHE